MRCYKNLVWIFCFCLIPSSASARPKAKSRKPAKARKVEAAGEARTAPKKPAAATPAPGTPAPAATTAPAAAPAAPKPPSDTPQSYVLRLRVLAQRVAELKEKVSQTKYRLSLLRESVLHGSIGGAQFVVVHHNQMGGSFRLISMRYALDGKPIFTKRDISETKLGRKGKATVYSGPLPPGQHILTVELRWRGHGYGVFSYLSGYRFKLISSHAFKAAEGTTTQIRVVAYEKGNITTPLKDRPALKFKTKVRALEAKTGKVK